MKVTATHNFKLPVQDSGKYKVMVGIIGNSFLADLARELDQGTNKIIPIPERVLKVVPEAREQGMLEWHGIPSRPFIEKTIAKYMDTWIKLLGEYVLKDKLNFLIALNKLGTIMLDNLKDVICNESWQENSDVWRLFKERTGTDPNPLLHTKKFLDSLSYKVVKIS